MSFLKTAGRILIALTISAPIFASAAQASTYVTYSWTTTSEGFGPHVDAPSSATFQVLLSAVQTGTITAIDITNIQFAYLGLSLNAGAVASSIGLDNAAYVNPTTGAFIFQDNNQGLAVVAYGGALFSDTFLSITVDNPVSGSVADQYNALNNGNSYAGYPTAGYWTASIPTVSTTPLPAALPLFATGLGGLGFLSWRRRKKAQATA